MPRKSKTTKLHPLATPDRVGDLPVYDMPAPNDGHVYAGGDLARVRRVKQITINDEPVLAAYGRVFATPGPADHALISPQVFEEYCDQDATLQKLLAKSLAASDPASHLKAIRARLMVVFEETYLVAAFRVFEQDCELVAEYVLAKAAELAVDHPPAEE